MELPKDWENLITCIQCKPPITVTYGAERVPEFLILGQDIQHSQNDKQRRTCIMAENKMEKVQP